MPDCDSELQDAIDAENAFNDAAQKAHDLAVESNRLEQVHYGSIISASGHITFMIIDLWVTYSTSSSKDFPTKGSWTAAKDSPSIGQDVSDWWSSGSALDKVNAELQRTLQQLQNLYELKETAWETWCECMDEEEAPGNV